MVSRMPVLLSIRRTSWLLFAVPFAALAAPIPWLYEVDVEVEAQTVEAREAASRIALVEVLARVSGLAHVPRNAIVRDALDSTERYYSRFVFLEDGFQVGDHVSSDPKEFGFAAARERHIDPPECSIWRWSTRCCAIWAIVGFR